MTPVGNRGSEEIKMKATHQLNLVEILNGKVNVDVRGINQPHEYR